MEITDLPDYIDVTLTESEAISFPSNGEIIKTQQIRLYCFNVKQFVATWPLRTRVMEATSKIASQFQSGLSKHQSQFEEDEEENQKSMDPQHFKQMMMMAGFDLLSGFDEFIDIAITGKLVELDDNVYMNKERWNRVEGTAQEKIFFAFTAHFILPCVL